jgi:hypothetical protein
MNLVCFLEEPSAKAMLEGVLPRILPEDVYVRYIVFEGKQDLEKKLTGKLRSWQMPDSIFLVMRDQDTGDCVIIKNSIVSLCRQAGKFEALVRIACHELESFYFGDLSAVERGLGIQNLVRHQKSRKYRQPDTIVNPSHELEKITSGKYQKIGGSRAVGKLLSVDNNTSHSFNVLISGIRTIAIREN